ncbi:nucleoside monophosphate kinase [Patescibacteria group bacterium]|nr:nucleoside monophosphate kinase [Patescibacteria group bacterium]MBU4274920.1 nucleoside monophosphate kinase [Patescibacteria group bacterium]MBU4367898.1 nucleoside monophosphate kinase [Patescibacteria group bacterium]MBU4461925.1 nucleoside monophosphate kinase [Patescibacteria group bacterium]MCG2699868.1 nucleoside monophosphate kinase [Candidatus Parcubacteria bacterium]
MNRQIVILFGPPGAGKGTQAELLSEKLNLFNFETSKILEEKFKEIQKLKEDSLKRFVEVAGEKFDVLKEKQLWLDGKLCSPPFVTLLIKEKIRKLYEEGENIIFSGSPRTIYEAEEELPLLEKLYGKENIKVFYIEISPEQTIYRNSNRKICELMRHSILFDKETKDLTICPLDGSKLLKRELDTPETIKVRIKEFQDRTYPIIDVYKKRNIVVNKIKGEQSISNVFKDILAIIR